MRFAEFTRQLHIEYILISREMIKDIYVNFGKLIVNDNSGVQNAVTQQATNTYLLHNPPKEFLKERHTTSTLSICHQYDMLAGPNVLNVCNAKLLRAFSRACR